MVQQAAAEAPRPTIKVFRKPNTPTLKFASKKTKNGSDTLDEHHTNSPSKTTESTKVIDKGSKLGPKTAKTDQIHELSHSKKRLADTSLERNGYKKTKRDLASSSSRKISGADEENNDKSMSKTSPEAPKNKTRAKEDREGNQQKRRKTDSTLGRDGLSAAHNAQSMNIRQRAAGLRNASNTCYYNAVLQTLVQTEPIREFCLASAEKFDNPLASNVVVGKHTTRQSARTQVQVANIFEDVDSDDV